MKEEEIIRKRCGKDNPFRVPENYFDDFASQLMEKLLEERNRTITLKPNNNRLHHILRPVLYAAACLCFAIFSAVAFFSNHVDSVQTSNKSANGSEVFIPTKNTKDEVELANMFRESLSKFFKDRGVSLESKSYHGKIAMLSGFDCCNVLLEVCFVSNKTDADAYNSHKIELAYEIALDILEFMRK